MKKFRIGISFFVLVIVSILTHNIVLFTNYILALFLHELAHLIVATKRGYTLKQIRLDIFGLCLELDDKIDDRDSFAINIAGPMTNLAIVVICMAIYWLVPASFLYLNSFCIANLVLAVFNMLPIYPLDGGKIVSSICVNNKVYRRIDFLIRIILIFVSISLFIYSYMTAMNIGWLIVALFFLTASPKKIPTLSIIKYSKNKHIDRVVMYKLTGEESIYDLLKKISKSKYTIFYYRLGQNRYIDEDHVIDLATKMSIKTKIKEMY